MHEGTSTDVTELLLAWNQGNEQAPDRVITRLYDALHREAARLLAREWRPRMLGTTSLLHQAYPKLVRQSRTQWSSRAQFLSDAAGIMHRLIIDYARYLQRGKRRGREVPFDDRLSISPEKAAGLLALDDALQTLGNQRPELVEVVELRYFVGFTHDEVAEILAIPRARARQLWEEARRRLRDDLCDEGGDP